MTCTHCGAKDHTKPDCPHIIDGDAEFEDEEDDEEFDEDDE